MNWQVLDSSSIKLQLIIMTEAQSPMEFVIGYLIPLNLNTFVTVCIFFCIEIVHYTAGEIDPLKLVHKLFPWFAMQFVVEVVQQPATMAYENCNK